MGKKKHEFQAPNYESIKSLEEADRVVDEQKSTLARKVKLLLQTKDNRKDMISSFNETINELNEEVEHIIGVLDALDAHKKALMGTKILTQADVRSLPPLPPPPSFQAQ